MSHLHALQGWSAELPRGVQLPRPGPVYGAYPMEAVPRRSSSAWLAWLQAWWRAPARPSDKGNRSFLQQVARARSHWQGLEDKVRSREWVGLRVRLGTQGFDTDLVARCFAWIAEVVQQHLGLAPHDVQLLAAWWMLGERLVEMATGEGKTLTVLFTSATAALAGVPVHVLTANDYLARRDATDLAPLYAALGLRVAFVTSASTSEERRLAYRADVVYVTAKELAFDHLRDRAVHAVGATDSLVLRGLCMAIVDEADSILIDEACMPLILARTADVREAEQRHRLALFLARQLKAGVDFVCQDGSRVALTQAGEVRVAQLSSHLTGAWRWQRYRHEQVSCALQALHVFERDVHYLVREQTIHIIDETTGRLAVGRAWTRGLHQMIAIKEGVPPQPESETMSQSSYQALFPRYLRLAGLSGTLHEDRAELLRVYGLPLCRVPLRVPSRRSVLPLQIAVDKAAKWDRVALCAQQAAEQGRPVLIGTDTVADSEALSRVLQARGLDHCVLNARQDEAQGEREREVIAMAGLPGRITVATHMAGRGTDILLTESALRHGGLHVINTNLNRSRRVDRQLIGRCARQGTPGSAQTILSWQDACWDDPARSIWLRVAVQAGRQGWLPDVLLARLATRVQAAAEARARRQRWQMLVSDAAMARQLALAGSEDWT